MTQDLAEALLASADCRAGLGDPAGARRAARRARAVLARRDNPRWVARADLALARLTDDRRPTTTRAANALRELAERLASLGLEEEARVAAYEAARHDPSGADTLRPPQRTDHLETRALWRSARAERALHSGRRTAGLTELRAGLREIDGARARLASPDLRSGTAALGRTLAARGLREAVERGHPAEVLAWAERSRAQALRHPPVVPPEDPDRAALLAELRSLRAAVAGHERPAEPGTAELRRRARQLEARLGRWHWEADGDELTGRQVSIGQVRERLGDRRAMVVEVDVAGARAALAISRERTAFVRLEHDPTEPARRLRATLDVLAGRELPSRLRASVEESLAA